MITKTERPKKPESTSKEEEFSSKENESSKKQPQKMRKTTKELKDNFEIFVLLENGIIQLLGQLNYMFLKTGKYDIQNYFLLQEKPKSTKSSQKDFKKKRKVGTDSAPNPRVSVPEPSSKVLFFQKKIF